MTTKYIKSKSGYYFKITGNKKSGYVKKRISKSEYLKRKVGGNVILKPQGKPITNWRIAPPRTPRINDITIQSNIKPVTNWRVAPPRGIPSVPQRKNKYISMQSRLGIPPNIPQRTTRTLKSI